MGEIEYNAAEAARYAELHPDAMFVLATDYAALEAQLATEKARIAAEVPELAQAAMEIAELTVDRDEWKRRCKKIAYRLRDKPDEPVIFVDSTDIVAIAEGRDKGGA